MEILCFSHEKDRLAQRASGGDAPLRETESGADGVLQSSNGEGQ